LWERHEGLRRIRILTLATGEEHLVPFPEPVYTVWPHENPEFDTTVLRFGYTSMVTPGSVIEYDLAARTWTVRKETPVLGYDRSQYRSERIFALAPDGVRAAVRARRPPPAAAQRLRRVRGELRSRLQLQPPQPAGPGLRGRHRPRARGRGAGARM